MINITKYHFLLIVVFLFSSCGIKTVLLKDGKTKIPMNAKAYQNKTKFNISLLNNIDTNALYEEYDTRYNVLTRLDNHIENSVYGVYKFYPNGNVNYFMVDRDSSIHDNDFNPLYTGYRGVFYEDKGVLYIDLFAEVNGHGRIGKIQEEVVLKGDTLLIKGFKTTSTTFIKKKAVQSFTWPPL